MSVIGKKRLGYVMETFDFKVQVPVGIHVRNAVILSQKVAGFKSDVRVCCGQRTANAKKLMDVMLLRVRCGEIIHVAVEGADELEAACEIRKFCEQNF